MRILDLSAHLFRVAGCATALVLVPGLAPLAAVSLFFAGFGLAHDLAHGALRLPRRINELALAVTGVVLLTSGHALRLMHLRHHAHALADDDLEGAAARLSLPGAVLMAPRLTIALRARAWTTAGPRAQRWQLLEHVACAAVVAAALVGPHWLGVYVAIALVAQLVAPVWAGHIPHRAPRWLLRIARALAFTRSPTVLALAFHDLHHAHPRVPCHQLGALGDWCRTPCS